MNKEPHELQEDDKKRHQIQAYQQLVVGRLPGGQAQICDQAQISRSSNFKKLKFQEDDKKRHQIQAYQQLVVRRLPGGQAQICDNIFRLDR